MRVKIVDEFLVLVFGVGLEHVLETHVFLFWCVDDERGALQVLEEVSVRTVCSFRDYVALVL